MRTTHCALLAFLAVLSGCGPSDDGDDGSGSGSGGTATGGVSSGGTNSGGTATGGAATGGTSSTGGASSTGGTSSTGGAGSATLAEHEAACRSFCEKFTAQCGLSCPETCDGYANTYGLECAALGVSFFDCYSALDPASYDCEAGYIQGVASDECVPETDDLVVCHDVGGIKCERSADDDAEDCGSTSGTPFAFRCVSEAVPSGCVPTPGGRQYCCPSE